MALYSLNGDEPTPLLFSQMMDDSGKLWTDLPENAGGMAALGLTLAPDKPEYDAASQVVTWDKPSRSWVVSAIPAPSLDSAKAAGISAAQAQFAGKIAAGFAYQGHPVQLDDGSQARLTAIGTTAIAASAGTIAWPAGYANGWIAADGVRIPLATPADGLTFSAAAGAYYANLVQHEQDLQDAINAATDAAGVAAVDVTAGWP